jgi:hypothetical protein
MFRKTSTILPLSSSPHWAPKTTAVTAVFARISTLTPKESEAVFVLTDLVEKADVTLTKA